MLSLLIAAQVLLTSPDTEIHAADPWPVATMEMTPDLTWSLEQGHFTWIHLLGGFSGSSPGFWHTGQWVPLNWDQMCYEMWNYPALYYWGPNKFLVEEGTSPYCVELSLEPFPPIASPVVLDPLVLVGLTWSFSAVQYAYLPSGLTIVGASDPVELLIVP